MKLVTAIIKPYKLDEGREGMKGMRRHGSQGEEVRGEGRQYGKTEREGGEE